MTDRVNRFLLLVIGLVLVAGALWGLMTAFETLPSWLPPMASPAEWYDTVVQAIEDDPLLWGAVTAAAALLVVVLAARWAVQQVRPNPKPRLSTTTLADGDHGRTTIEPVALARAAAHDLGGRPGILRADARLASLGDVVRIELQAVLAEGMDRRRADAAVAKVLDRLRQAAGSDDVRADVRLRYTDRGGARVR